MRQKPTLKAALMPISSMCLIRTAIRYRKLSLTSVPIPPAPCEADEDGTIAYTGKPDVYHIQIIDYPEGYSCDESFEMYTPETYGEWVLRLHKD